MDSLTINPKDFDGDPIISHKSAIEKLSKVISIWGSEVNEDLAKLQNYSEEFIFTLKHQINSTESGVQEIAK